MNKQEAHDLMVEGEMITNSELSSTDYLNVVGEVVIDQDGEEVDFFDEDYFPDVEWKTI